MARVGIKIYKNSALATVVSIIGCCFELGGITVMANGGPGYLLNGFLLILWGVAHLAVAERLSDYAQYRTWKRQLEQKIDVESIAQNKELAIQVYQSNPCKRVLKFIQNLNPEAAEQIKQQFPEVKKPKKGLIRAAAIGGVLILLVGIFALVQSSKTPKFSVGIREGNHYASSFLEIQCTLDDDWGILSDQELAEKNKTAGDTTGNLMGEDYQKRLEKAGFFYDLLAQRRNDLTSLSLSIEKLSGTGRYATEMQHAQLAVDDSKKALEIMDVAEITTDVSEITFAGKTHACIRMKGTVSGWPVYATQVLLKQGDRMAVITVESIETDHTDEILSLFQPFSSK